MLVRAMTTEEWRRSQIHRSQKAKEWEDYFPQGPYPWTQFQSRPSPAKVGEMIVVVQPFQTDSGQPVWVEQGDVGTVKKIDKAGDLSVDFQRHPSLHWVKTSNFDNIEKAAFQGDKLSHGRAPPNARLMLATDICFHAISNTWTVLCRAVPRLEQITFRTRVRIVVPIVTTFAVMALTSLGVPMYHINFYWMPLFSLMCVVWYQTMLDVKKSSIGVNRPSITQTEKLMGYAMEEENNRYVRPGPKPYLTQISERIEQLRK